jgi:hypothetical protein
MAQGTTKRIATRVAVVGCAVAAVTGITAASTLAATTYTVKAGTKTSGTSAYTGKSGAITFTDGSLALGCDGGTAKGVATLGPNVRAKVATITATTWKNCSGPGGLVLKPKQNGTWTVNALGATTAAGVTKGYVGNVNARVSSSPDASQCSFTVTGAAVGNYNNSTGKLTLTPTSSGTRVLKVSDVTGCFSLIKNGDTVTFGAAYTITTATGKLSIKSN